MYLTVHFSSGAGDCDLPRGGSGGVFSDWVLDLPCVEPGARRLLSRLIYDKFRLPSSRTSWLEFKSWLKVPEESLGPRCSPDVDC